MRSAQGSRLVRDKMDVQRIKWADSREFLATQMAMLTLANSANIVQNRQYMPSTPSIFPSQASAGVRGTILYDSPNQSCSKNAVSLALDASASPCQRHRKSRPKEVQWEAIS